MDLRKKKIPTHRTHRAAGHGDLSPCYPEVPKPRILIVDNDPRTRNANQSLLQLWNYEPVLASGAGPTLVENALLEARRSRCSLALIDLRLMDDTDDDDTSGLDLAEEKWPVKSIIFSGHGNLKILRKIMDEHKDLIFIGKTDARPNIHETLDREAKKLCAAKRGLQIEPAGILDQIAQTPLGAVVADYPDQIADVLARLFPEAHKLRMEKLDSSLLSTPRIGTGTMSPISTVPRPKSIILKVYEDEFQPVIVKLARPEKIRKEVERYATYIAKRLTGSYAPRLEQYAILWDIGGAVYSCVGDFTTIKTFSQFYEDSSIEDIQESLRIFFTETWGDYYSDDSSNHSRKVLRNASLFKLYCDVWERDWYDKRVKNFSMLPPASINSIHEKIDIPDPVAWLIDNVASNPENDASRVARTFTTITHGDLHAENLLIDRKKNAWAIDFERSGEGHALQDFIELESDLLNRLTYPQSNANGSQEAVAVLEPAHSLEPALSSEKQADVFSFYRLCVTIVQQDKIGPIPIDELTPTQPEIRKMLQTMSILRELALQCTEISDMRQYLIGLLFNAIFRATITNDIQYPRSQQRALMLASIICHRLEHWNEAWPPPAWKNMV